MRFGTFLIGILLFAVLSTNASAQQAHPVKTGWLVEVRYLKGTLPTYEFVHWPESKTPGSWYARFGRVTGWQLPAGIKRVHAVKIVPCLQDETVIVKVSVLRGQFMDIEEPVGNYELVENEKFNVEALRDFGVEPFELRAFKSAPLLANQPTSLNETTSVEIVGIEPINSDMPQYKLTVRNLTQKTIDALKVEIVDGQRRLSFGMPQGREGKPLMGISETVQIPFPLHVRANGEGAEYAPAVPLQQQIVIKSVTFSDGTTDGVIERDTESGAGFHSVKFGQRIELQRALPLFTAALESATTSSDGVAAFRVQLEALNTEITDADLLELQQRFPTQQPKLKPSVELGLHLVRREILSQLAHFESNEKGRDFRSWLVESRDRYSNWLARLESIPVPQP